MRLLICTQAVDKQDPILGFFHRWLEEFSKHAEHVTVICLRKGEYSLPHNVEVISLGTNNRVQRTLEVCSIALGRMREYDAVFVHMNPEYVVAAGWLWRLLQKPVALWYVHRADTWLLRLAHALSTTVFTVSKESFPFGSTKVLFSGHGIDLERFAPKEHHHEGFRIVTIGRISEKKNTLVMAKAIHQLSQEYSDISLDIIGAPVTEEEREYESELREWASDKAEVIRLRGPMPHDAVPEILQGADVFVNMGETGGVDKAILEAAACSIPSVSSGEANRRVLEEVSSILSIQPTKEALMGSIAALHAMEPQQRHVIGRSLRAIVERDHTLTKLIQKIIWSLSKNK